MECRKVREKLLAYAEGDLGELCHALIDSHLARCYTCREELNEWHGTIEACRAALRHPEPCSRFEELRARIASMRRIAESEASVIPWKTTRRSWRQHLGSILKAAAVLVVFLWPSWWVVNGARQVLAPLHQSPAGIAAPSESKPAVAPLAACRFIERRIEIEEYSQG